MFGDKCRFKNVLQCEFDKRKRTWIKSFSRPEMLTGDVEQLKVEQLKDTCNNNSSQVLISGDVAWANHTSVPR